MSEYYQPPVTMTEEVTNLVIEIGELVGHIALTEQLSSNPKLRRENRIKTIHSSLAIEQNTLTLEQVSAVIDGKRVLAPPQDIREVQNAFEAYEQLSVLNPYRLEDLLKAHKFMMNGLVNEAGCFRSKGVGVYAGERLIHAGTPPQYVPDLMKQLFMWLENSNLHPLIKSCVFHYEFEFIHPFTDGNGRTGRLWHSLILQKWKPFFAWMPVETLIHEQQDGYYWALNASNTEGESTIFVTFMLKIIRDALAELVTDSLPDNPNVGINVGINVGANVGVNDDDFEEVVLLMLKDNPKLSAKKLAEMTERSTRQIERIFKRLKEKGKLERVGASKNGSWKVI